MTLTAFPQGVSSFGMPVLGSSGLMTTGNVFFVDSGAASAANGNAMTDPKKPGATIDAAIGRCTANNGDIIIVMPGHTEALTTSIAMDVAGVSVIGLGIGHTRPLLSYTGTGGVVTITASNVRWSNIVHDCSIAAVTNAILANGTISHVELDNCHFTFDATGVEFTVMVKLGSGATDSADYVNIHDNWFEAESIDGCGSALLMDDCDFIHIRNNLFTGDFNSVAIDGAAASSACKNFVITGNIVENRDTGLTIDLDDAATGIISNNYVAGGGAIAGIVDWGACLVVRNFVTDLADVSGVLVPSTTAS